MVSVFAKGITRFIKEAVGPEVEALCIFLIFFNYIIYL